MPFSFKMLEEPVCVIVKSLDAPKFAETPSPRFRLPVSVPCGRSSRILRGSLAGPEVSEGGPGKGWGAEGGSRGSSGGGLEKGHFHLCYT